MKEIQLNPQQVEAVSHKDGPMVVLSVAGSGKTMVLIERLIHLIEEHSINPANLLAITFAKKAVLEIQSRLEKRLNGTGDKAMVCTFHSLGYRILKAERFPITGFSLVHDGAQMDLFREAMKKVNVKEDPTSLLSKISLAKNDLISPPDLEKSSKPQDSSKVMIELVKLSSAQHQNVWLAGDDDQSIYSFRGARSDIFVSLDKEYGTNTKTIKMPHNYRSTGNILKSANSLISHNKVRVKKSMVTDNSEGEEIEIIGAKNEIAEAEIIAQRIVELKELGYRYGQIAILVRLHKLMPLIEAALIKDGIPYSSIGGFLYNRKEIRTVIATMKFLLNSGSIDGLDLDLLEKIRSDLYADNEKMSFRDAFDIAGSYLMMKPGNDDVVVNEEDQPIKRHYLDALEYLVSPHQNLEDFIDHVEESRRVNSKSSTERVNMMTIHQAKGLQFKCVFVPGLNEGILPHIKSIEDLVNLEEERRLLYVAITRAMERVFITYRRTQRDQPITTRSRFITELSA